MSKILVVSSQQLDRYLICGWALKSFNIIRNNATDRDYVEYKIEWSDSKTDPKIPDA